MRHYQTGADSCSCGEIWPCAASGRVNVAKQVDSRGPEMTSDEVDALEQLRAAVQGLDAANETETNAETAFEAARLACNKATKARQVAEDVMQAALSNIKQAVKR